MREGMSPAPCPPRLVRCQSCETRDERPSGCAVPRGHERRVDSLCALLRQPPDQSNPSRLLLRLIYWRAVSPAGSEFQSGLERDHARRAVAAQPNSQQSGGRRSRVAESSESGLGGRFARNPRVHQIRKSEVRVVEDVEEPTINAQLHTFRQLKPLGQIQVTPDEVGTTQCVPPEIAELAIGWAITACTCAGARIDGRNKRVRVEPLDGSRLSHAG